MRSNIVGLPSGNPYANAALLRQVYNCRKKTEKLWAEINNAYNRDRDVQKIKRVDHPTRNVEFRAGDEKLRQIYSRSVQLNDLATYVSAYEVAIPLIPKVEALLVRGFANDLLNVKMEHFSKRKGVSRRT